MLGSYHFLSTIHMVHIDDLRLYFLAQKCDCYVSLGPLEDSSSHLKSAAVLIGIILRPDPTVLLTVRAAHLSQHPGQIAFPGGRVDQDDEHVVATALREAGEEVGLLAHQAEVLGTLAPYVTQSSYEVTPVIALLSHASVFRPNAAEVAEIFEVPLSLVMDPQSYVWHDTETIQDERSFFSGAQSRSFWVMLCHVDGQSRCIWGATAAMLRSLCLAMQGSK